MKALLLIRSESETDHRLKDSIQISQQGCLEAPHPRQLLGVAHPAVRKSRQPTGGIAH